MDRVRIALSVMIAITIVALSACDLVGVTASTATPEVAYTPTLPLSATSVTEGEVSLEEQVEAIYDEAGPAVVHITSRIYTYDFFMRAIPQEGTGSGFVYDGDGHIVTNYHVVAEATAVLVTLAGGEAYAAKVVGMDPSTDLAVVRIEAQNLPDPIPLGDSDRLRVGQFVVAIGNPFGLERTLTMGVISSLGRVIESPDGRLIVEAIQTDAAINPGNSGGPLLDLQGRVIGVNSQIISPSGAWAGIGFAVSSNAVERAVPHLIAEGRYPHPWLGISLFPLSAELAQLLRDAGTEVPVDQGLLVMEVVPGSPGHSAGIRGGDRTLSIGNVNILVGGDILTAINAEPMSDLEDLIVYLESEAEVGDTVELTLIRNGGETAVEVTLADRPE